MENLATLLNRPSTQPMSVLYAVVIFFQRQRQSEGVEGKNINICSNPFRLFKIYTQNMHTRVELVEIDPCGPCSGGDGEQIEDLK